ncbi:MAG: hypothetical protein Q4C66_05885 [Lachnospiraceae bacterium]|nr:hypothetical protein [Lachnospiraceae bacterium]
MLKRVIIILTILLAAVMTVFFWQGRREEQNKQAQYRQMELEAQPLNVKKQGIQQEIWRLEADYSKQLSPMGTAVILFTSPDAEVYTKCYPVMREHGYLGVVALSASKFPGEEGCMTQEQFAELLRMGWRFCVIWEPPVERTAERLQSAGMSLSEVVYFPEGTYASQYDKELKEMGFSVAVHHGEESGNILTLEDEEEIWHPGAVGLRGSQAKYWLREAVSQKGNMVFAVGFEQQEELYDERKFQNMIDSLDSYRTEGSIMVTDFAGARSLSGEAALKKITLEPEYNKNREELEEELRQVNEELDAVYKKYLEN